jgi:cysteine synthase A
MKKKLPRVLAFAVETQGSILGGGPPGKHKVEGIGASFIPKNFDRSVCDEILMVSDKDAFDTVNALAAKEGVLSGSSGGASVFAAMQIAQRLGNPEHDAQRTTHDGLSDHRIKTRTPASPPAPFTTDRSPIL